MTTTKKEDLAKEISETHGISKAMSRRIVDQVFDTISDNLKDGKKTMIVGFGTFEAKERKERKGYNLVKKQVSLIEEARIPSFKPSSILEEKVKKGE